MATSASKKKKLNVSTCQSSSEAPTAKRRVQTYRVSYAEEWKFIRPGKDEFHAFCEVCSCDIGVKHGGRDDVRRHIEETDKHEKNAKLREQQQANSKITGFFQRGATSTASNLDMDVIRSETLMVELAVELNLPMAAMDKISKGVKKAFPDSIIAKNFQCARSKSTAIVKEIAAKTTLSLAERMKTLPFTISTDGSNDKGGATLFPLIVRTIDPDTKEVRSDALSVPAIEGSATGTF